jgi:hypothetical protein
MWLAVAGVSGLSAALREPALATGYGQQRIHAFDAGNGGVEFSCARAQALGGHPLLERASAAMSWIYNFQITAGSVSWQLVRNKYAPLCWLAF